MPIKIDFLANVSKLLRGTKDASKGLDDVADSLDDVVKDGDKAERQLERNFREIADAAKKADKQVDKIGDNSGKSFGKAGQATGEFKDEALSNFSEVTSSFDGSMSSIQDLAQGTLGGLATSGLPGIGLAAGAAATAVGLIGASIIGAAEDADELRDRLSGAYSDAAAAGRDYLDTATIIANQQDLMFNPERADEWKKVQDTQKQTGLDWSTILKANAGDLDALARVQGRVSERNKELADSGEEANLFLDAGGTAIQKLEGFWKQLGDTATIQDKLRQESIENTNQLLREEIDATQGVTVEVDKLGNEVYTLPSGKQIKIDAKTKKATEDLDGFQGDLDGIPEKVTTTLAVNDNDAYARAARLRDYLSRGINIPVTLTQQNGRRWV